MSAAQRSSTLRDYRERVLEVLVHIQRHLGRPLRLEELAARAHFSPFHFHRVFRGMVGESVQQHVRRLRLERAAMQLKTGRQPITEVAFAAGYEAHESFTRAFRAAFGCSPSAYRKAASMSARVACPAGVHLATPGGEVTFAPLTIENRPLAAEVRALAPTRVAFLRHTGPYQEVGATWERLMDWAGRECLFGPETRLFGACYDDPEVTAPDKLRYDACLTVGEDVPPEDDIAVRHLAGGNYAVALHEGPYAELGETYAALFGRWFPSTGHEAGDPPCLEFYLNDPDATEPVDLLTEIWVRLRR